MKKEIIEMDMKTIKSVDVELNGLEKLFSETFQIGNFYVGYDFLVLSERLNGNKRMELSLWASAVELNEEQYATYIELLVGIRDENEDLDMVRSESFDVTDYEGSDQHELLSDMIEIVHFEVSEMGN